MSLESQFRQNLEDLDGRIHSILEHLEIAKGAKTRTAELAMEALHGVRKGTKVLVDGFTFKISEDNPPKEAKVLTGGITFEVVQVLTRGLGGLCLPLEDLAPANVGQKPWIKVQAGLYMHLIEPSRWTLPPKEGPTP